jgi:hypothetical protein
MPESEFRAAVFPMNVEAVVLWTEIPCAVEPLLGWPLVVTVFRDTTIREHEER